MRRSGGAFKQVCIGEERGAEEDEIGRTHADRLIEAGVSGRLDEPVRPRTGRARPGRRVLIELGTRISTT